MAGVPPRLPGISVVCVFNDPKVREECLDRSIAANSGAVDVDYVPVDNTGHAFSTAGAALNHGASLARHDVVVFAHQDVYLHSVDRLAAVAAHLAGEQWGVLGANGFSRGAESVGMIRDRVQLIGSDEVVPREVDSLDEVLFMVRRDRVLSHPLTEDPDLAWHAYAVEYGLRMRRLGLGVGAANLAVTHNSLTINLARLDVAHRRVAALYPERLPVQTTCGEVGERSSTWKDAPVIRDHRWRLRWLRSSKRAMAARQVLDVPVVLGDIRMDVDDLNTGGRLNVVNLDRVGGFVGDAPGAIQLTRRDTDVVFWAAATVEEVLEVAASLAPSESVLLADLSAGDLPALTGRLPEGFDWLLGLHDDTTWLLGGPAARDLPDQWFEPRAVPLGPDRRERRRSRPA